MKQHWIVDSNERQNSPGKGAVSFIGAPDDRGVLSVGGRLGAGHGPYAIRQMLANYMLGIQGELENLEVYQGLDLDPGPTLEAGHENVRKAVCSQIQNEIFPIVLGGSHDYGYPHVAGVFDALGDKIAVINVDAHLDVRPVGEAGITSGSPFYLALENKVLKPSHFSEFGIQEHCNDVSLYRYLEEKKVEILMLDDIRTGRGGVLGAFNKLLAKYSKKGCSIIVSFDVDAVQMAFAPGVSAPQADGFTPSEFMGMAKLAGENANVASIGFFEVAPSLDESQKTSRLTATAIHRFLMSFSQRGGQSNRGLGRGVNRLLRRPPKS